MNMLFHNLPLHIRKVHAIHAAAVQFEGRVDEDMVTFGAKNAERADYTHPGRRFDSQWFPAVNQRHDCGMPASG